MDLDKVKKLRQKLSLHFAIIAWLTAMLVATGTGTMFLPVFIFFVSLVAYILVDRLEWFELGQISSALGMCAATGIAVASYLYSAFYAPSESGQLLAVAGLLVYPEAVLFLQRKNLRIFEQLAVFLLLEMIVAALVNDNILFAILLAPIMLLWVSSLFLFSRYATLVSIDPSIETPTPKLAEVLFKKFVKTVLGDSKRTPVVTGKYVASSDTQRSSTLRRALQSFPIGLGALVFAGMFFYLLPRTSPAGFDTGLGPRRSVGLPERLTFGSVGKILQDRTPVMRVGLREALTRKLIRPTTPPYLRARVFDSYGPSHWRTRIARGQWVFAGALRPSDIVRGSEQSIFQLDYRDPVIVEFDIKRDYSSALFSVPPAYATNRPQPIPLLYDPVFMVMQKLEDSHRTAAKSISYELLSGGFRDGTQLAVTPALLTRSTDPQRIADSAGWLQRELVKGFHDLPNANAARVELLQRWGVDPADKVELARRFEDYFVYSGDFTYTLDLHPPSDPDWDPVEDFIVNQRAGHCQYFASAMVCWLRQSGIPSRIVIGYRPTKFNTLGSYFQVRQNDAHAWVEALFSRAELADSYLKDQLTDSQYYWVRFDPTPAEEGELAIVEQEGQALDYAEKLWKDYVVEGDKLSGENSIYAPVSGDKNAYQDLLSRFEALKANLMSGQFRPRIGFAWPIAIGIIMLGGLAIAVWQAALFLPRFAPKWARRMGLIRSDLDLQHPFYARCLRLVERLGVRRKASDTPQEFTQHAADLLPSDLPSRQSLNFLTDLYYRLRFSPSATPTSEEAAAIDRELRTVEEAVTKARRNGSTRTPTAG